MVNGGLKCWGQNSSGTVGVGSVLEKLTPVAVFPAGSNVQAVSLPYETVSCAIINSAMKCWGSDPNYSTLGIGKVTRGALSVVGFEN